MKKNLILSETQKFTSWTASALAVTLLLLATMSGHATVQIVQTFDASLGNWAVTIPNYGSNVNYAINWNNSGNASGSAGELLFQSARLSVGQPTPLSMPRVLDTASFAGGNTLNLNSPLSVSGQMYFGAIQNSADTTLHVGYFDSSVADPSQERLMLRIVGPNAGKWRFQFGGPGGNSGTRTTVPDTTWQGTSLGFQFLWTPSGLNDGSGTLSGTVMNGATTWTVPSYAIAANTAVFDSFGIWADSSGSTILANQQIQYFDNIVYTVVPEPTTAMLLPLGTGFLLLARRKLRRA